MAAQVPARLEALMRKKGVHAILRLGGSESILGSIILLCDFVVITHRNGVVGREVANYAIAQDREIGGVDHQRGCCYSRESSKGDFFHGLAPILFSIYSDRANRGIESSASAEMGEGPDLVLTMLAPTLAIGGAIDEPSLRGRINWYTGVVFARRSVPPDVPGGIGADFCFVAAFFSRRDKHRVHHW